MLTIGKLSKLTGVPTSAIRFYEKQGIIKSSKRADSGYRVFPESAVREIIFVKSAQNSGLRLQDVVSIAKGLDKCDTIQLLLEFRRREAEDKIKELRGTIQRINSALNSCQQSDSNDLCKCM